MKVRNCKRVTIFSTHTMYVQKANNRITTEVSEHILQPLQYESLIQYIQET